MAKDFNTASTSNPTPPKSEATAVAAPKTVQDGLVTKIIGPFGRYQLWMFCLLSSCKFFIAMNQMAIIFYAPKIKFSCPGSDKKCPCAKPEYEKNIFTKTIIMDWNLICARESLVSLNQTFFQLGTLLGSIGFGMASDKWGRRPPLLFAVILQISAGIGGSFVKDYWIFTFLRFTVGLSVGGTMVITFVLLMEFIGSKYREIISALYHLPFNMGHMLLPLAGYFYRDWSKFLLAISIPSMIQLSYFCLCPESPRWLLASQRSEKTTILLTRVAKMNRRPTDTIKDEVVKEMEFVSNQNQKKGTFTDLFRTRRIRRNIIIMSFQWFTCSYSFYGVSQFVGQLSGDIFSNVLASASFGLLGCMGSVPLLKYLGRKTIIIMFNFTCGIIMCILAIIPEGLGRVLCACIGCISSFIVFVTVYLHCSELFPTMVRNAALGFSSMMARVGSMIAPFVVQTGSVARYLPPILFGMVPLLGGILTFWLPETKGHPLMTTIEEAENFGKVIDERPNSSEKPG